MKEAGKKAGDADVDLAETVFSKSKAFDLEELFEQNYGYLIRSKKGDKSKVQPLQNNAQAVIDIAKDRIEEKLNNGTLAPDTTEQEITATAEAELGRLPGESVATIDTLDLAKKYENWLTGGELTPEKKQELLDDLRTRQTKLEEEITIGAQEPDLEMFRAQRPFGRFTFKTYRKNNPEYRVSDSVREAYLLGKLQAKTPAAEEERAKAKKQKEDKKKTDDFMAGLDFGSTEPTDIGLSSLDPNKQIPLQSQRSTNQIRARDFVVSPAEQGNLLGGSLKTFLAGGRGAGYRSLDEIYDPDISRLTKDREDAFARREKLEQDFDDPNAPLTKRVGESIDRDAPFSEEMYLSRALFGKASPFAEQQEDERDGPSNLVRMSPFAPDNRVPSVRREVERDGPVSAEELGVDLTDDEFFVQQIDPFEGEERLEISGGLPEELLARYDKNIKEISAYLEASRISKEDYLKELGGGDKAKGELKIAQMSREELKDSILRIKAQKDAPSEKLEEE